MDAPEREYDAIVLAAAGLQRINLADRISSYLSADSSPPFPYAVGQGALVVECRTEDAQVKELLRSIHDNKTSCEVSAERAVMRCLEGGCSVPIAVSSTWSSQDTLRLVALVVKPDGSHSISAEGSAKVSSDADAEALGNDIAGQLINKGAKDILSRLKESSK